MGIFGSKKTEKTEEKKNTKKDVVSEEQKSVSEHPLTTSEALVWNKRKDRVASEVVLKKPRITEKAAIQSSKGVYTFEVDPKAKKNEIIKAFKQIYNKTPVKVNVMNLASKKRRTRFGIGETRRRRKAVVFLKEGETIDFV